MFYKWKESQWARAESVKDCGFGCETVEWNMDHVDLSGNHKVLIFTQSNSRKHLNCAFYFTKKFLLENKVPED